VTQLRKRMLEELQRRNCSQATTRSSYILAVKQFAEYFGQSSEKLGAKEIRLKPRC
jgi:integrase/recombinase XerD